MHRRGEELKQSIRHLDSSGVHYGVYLACHPGRHTIRGAAGNYGVGCTAWCQTLAVTSEKSPIVLLHSATGSGRIWQDVVPLLSEHHDVHAPTLLGHRGGPAIQRRPAGVSDVVDAAERYLDEHGLARPHLAGNSLGGWVAIELARRGRAASVCAFSPAGFWWDSDSHQQVFGQIRRMRALTRVSRPMAPLASDSH